MAKDEELILTHYFFASHFIKNQKIKLTSLKTTDY